MKFNAIHRTQRINKCTDAWLNRFEDSDELLTIGEVAERLKCSIANVYSLTRRRRANRGLLPLPHRKIGRKLYFVWHDIIVWLNAQRGYELPVMERSATK